MNDKRNIRDEIYKKYTSQYAEMRKRSFKFFFLNILIVLSVFILILVSKNFSTQVGSSIVDGLQLMIELSKIEYYAPEKLLTKVYLVNTQRTEKTFIISDFNITVYSSETTVYKFSYQQPIESSIKGQTRRLVYDLSREVNLSNLKTNKYTIEVNAKINGKSVSVKREFTYKEELIFLPVFEDFYLVGEKSNLKVGVNNRTSEGKKLSIGLISFVIEGQEFLFKPDKEFILGIGDYIEIDTNQKFDIKQTGKIPVKLRVEYDGKIEEVGAVINATGSFDRKIGNVSFTFESEEYVRTGTQTKVKLYMQNKDNKEKYLLLKKLSVSIPEITYNFVVENRRILLTPFANRLIVILPNLIFSKPGLYNVLVTVETVEDKVQKQLTLSVGN